MHNGFVRVSAGILLYRFREDQLEVLLGHPGGPFHARKDRGNWSIPKGEVEPNEALEAVAAREFEEETGHRLPSESAWLELGTIRQKGGKLVHAWAVEGDIDPAAARSNTFELEWPPGSGRLQRFPEIDRVAWFVPADAREHVKDTQIPFVDRLVDVLDAADRGSRRGEASSREPFMRPERYDEGGSDR